MRIILKNSRLRLRVENQMEMKGPFKGEQGYYMSREGKLDWGNLHGRIYGGHKGNVIMNTPKLESRGHLGLSFRVAFTHERIVTLLLNSFRSTR